MSKQQIRRRIQSFRYAFQGVFHLFKTELHAKVHLSAALLAIILGSVLKLSIIEWALIVVCIFTVLAAEAFNTAIEELTNLVSPQRHPLAGRVKDLSAGAVLLSAIGAAVCGILIFFPKILEAWGWSWQ